MQPERIWALSIALHRRGWRHPARVLKAINFALFHCALPPEARVGPGVRFYHHGLGVVITPHCELGRNVSIGHNVTIGLAGGLEDVRAGEVRVVVGDRVSLGAGCVLLAVRGRTLHVGEGAAIGANVVVTRDVEPGARIAAAHSSTLDTAV